MKTLNRISLLIGILGMAWMIHKIGPGEIATVMERISMWFLLILAINIAAMALEARATHLFMRPEGRMVAYWRVLAAKFAGQAINLATPTGTLGEATKVAMLAGSAPKARVISSVILFNVNSLIINLLLITIGPFVAVMIVPMHHELKTIIIVSSAGVGVLLVGLLYLVRRGMLTTLLQFIGKLHIFKKARVKKWIKDIKLVNDQMRDFRIERPRDFWVGFAQLCASKVLQALELWVILIALHARSGPGFTLLVLSIGQLVSWLANVVPFGLGTAEGGNYLLFEMLHADPSAGVMVQIVSRLRKIVFIALGLSILFWAQRSDLFQYTRAFRKRRRTRSVVTIKAAEEPPGPPG